MANGKMHQLAVLVRKYLELRDMSERELSRITGLSQKTVNGVVNERNPCTIETAAIIADALQLPMWQLFVWGRANSDASPSKLSKVMHAYLAGDESTRKALERIADNA